MVLIPIIWMPVISIEPLGPMASAVRPHPAVRGSRYEKGGATSFRSASSSP